MRTEEPSRCRLRIERRSAPLTAVPPVAGIWIVPARVRVADRIDVVRIRVRRVGVERNAEREREHEEAVEPATVVEDEAVVREAVEASREAAELSATELTAERTADEVPASETSAAERSREAADVATAEATGHVPAAEAAAMSSAPHAERDAGVHREREDDDDRDGEKPTAERAQRPMDRRELHGGSLVALSEGVKAGWGSRALPQARCTLRYSPRRPVEVMRSCRFQR